MKKLFPAFTALAAIAMLAVSACTQEEINQFLNSVNSIKLDQTQVEMTVGETLHLIATVDPFKGDTKVVTWTSSSPDVASVKGTEVPDVAGINMPAGEVTALKEGVFLGKVLEYSPRFFIFHPLTVAPLALEDYVLTVRNLNEANHGHSYF